jgi:DegV family protein with EDD domain
MQLTAARCAIAYDSTADLPDGPRRHAGWAMVPLTVHFGSESFRDYVDLPIEEFYRRLVAAPTPPTTSQPTPAAFAAVYAELLARYEHVVSLHLSGKLSGTVESARLAAAACGGRVTVIDTGFVSALLALAVEEVQAMLDAGTTLRAIEARVAALPADSGCIFAVDTLEYLQRGGRIGKARAMLGTLLSVRPILAIEHGELEPVRRVRGARKVQAALCAELEARAPAGPLRLAIAHAAAPAAAAALRAAVVAARPDAAVGELLTLGAVVGTHSGPGALGLAWTAVRP